MKKFIIFITILIFSISITHGNNKKNDSKPSDNIFVWDIEITVPYPNPFTNEISFKFNELIEKIVIYNTLGNIMLSENKPIETIDTSHLNAGFYVVLITKTNGNQIAFKMIKT